MARRGKKPEFDAGPMKCPTGIQGLDKIIEGRLPPWPGLLTRHETAAWR
jgi:hypothetical protein